MMKVQLSSLDSKLLYLDGLRGLCAFLVFVHHFLFAVDPSLFELYIKPINSLEYLINYPWGFIFNGSYAVKIFFVHSGFVLSYSFFTKNCDRRILVSASVRRYFRLTIPLAFSVLVAYFLVKFNLMWNQTYGTNVHNRWLLGYYKFDASFIEMLKQATYSTYSNFRSATTYNSVLWTISYELKGSFFVYLLLFLIGKMPWRVVIYFILLFVMPQKIGMQAFLLGIMLADGYVNGIFRKINSLWATILLIAGIAISFIREWPVGELSAFIVILSFFNLPKIQNLFSKPIMTFLGKTSFSSYLLHFPLICSLVSFLKFQDFLSTLIIFLLTTAILYIASWFTYLWVDLKAIEFGHFIWKKIAERYYDKLVGIKHLQ